ncbi:hypothetical protein DIE19_35125 [Burkholderia sp. Bp9126]|nr:hypothetical protein DIE19_35125 [Burkholderia sp. Bp9126]
MDALLPMPRKWPLEDTGKAPKEVVVDLDPRGVDHDNPGVEIIHRGKRESQTPISDSTRDGPSRPFERKIVDPTVSKRHNSVVSNVESAVSTNEFITERLCL